MSGRLSIVATPIGCLADITLRALDVLRAADRVLAEDTRRTRVLLTHHGITTRTESFHAHSPDAKVDSLVAEMLAGAHLALVSDAGMPLLSDPGGLLVRAAAEAGVRVEAIPGPSAITTALVVSALVCDEFRFVGFLPRAGSRRERALARIAADEATTVLFESPKRLGRTLRDLEDCLGPTRRIAVCRELTKVHEEVARGTASELLERFGDETRGEVTLVVEGRSEEEEAKEETPLDADALLEELLGKGLGAKEVAFELARATGLPRKEAYRRVVARRG
ncbi:MAG: 16S rRNA (cytidine(1402)-2'-O)-methyltransferase [Polyangiaceae bacterium]|nr:16S rRNA (cytidine(1402)-2'-O)-methyltransferase [Polyangiaceae bacterium]